ncbi:hypothetical protein AALP_AA7G010700 [Arabis alpina]|uniref:Uncharacterized protein n=1 Tax=Arabis alpina TaxID=50452 RepID=A0A087GF95_ARAAL|nr:hypothetical protein AALP_AA7G010700 [Arabis alpina]
MNLGTVPFKLLPLRSKYSRSGIEVKESGIDPDNLLELKDRNFKETKSPISSGSVPEIEFDDKFKEFRFGSRVKEMGIVPLMELFDKSMNVRFGCRDLGMLPVRLALEIDKVSIFRIFPRITNKPEVETEVKESVKVVRFTKRAKETPVRRGRRWKEFEAVNEVREFGKCGGGEREGQFWKESFVSDGERDLKAVEEIESEVEQFVKERLVTKRNGVVEEQVMMVEEEEQGSLMVGMFSDWSALSCVGSNGEVECLVCGVGDLVGDGVGEREGVEEIVVVKRRKRRRSNGGGSFMVKRESLERVKEKKIGLWVHVIVLCEYSLV